MVTLRTHDSMIFGGMNGKWIFWKWILLVKEENDEIIEMSFQNSCDKIAIEKRN